MGKKWSTSFSENEFVFSSCLMKRSTQTIGFLDAWLVFLSFCFLALIVQRFAARGRVVAIIRSLRPRGTKRQESGFLRN